MARDGYSKMVAEALEASKVLEVAVAKMAAMVWTAIWVAMVLTVVMASMVAEALVASKVLPDAMVLTAAMLWTATWVAMVSTVETALMVAVALEVPWDLLVEMAEMAPTK